MSCHLDKLRTTCTIYCMIYLAGPTVDGTRHLPGKGKNLQEANTPAPGEEGYLRTQDPWVFLWVFLPPLWLRKGILPPIFWGEALNWRHSKNILEEHNIDTKLHHNSLPQITQIWARDQPSLGGPGWRAPIYSPGSLSLTAQHVVKMTILCLTPG